MAPSVMSFGSRRQTCSPSPCRSTVRPFDRSTANGTSCDSERMDYSRNATLCAPGRVPPWCDMLVTGVRHGDRPLAPRRLRRCNAGIRHAGPRRARRRPLASGRMARLGAAALATPAGRSARRTTHPLLALATRHARPAPSVVLRDIGAPGTTPRQLSRAARPRSALTSGARPSASGAPQAHGATDSSVESQGCPAAASCLVRRPRDVGPALPYALLHL